MFYIKARHAVLFTRGSAMTSFIGLLITLRRSRRPSRNVYVHISGSDLDTYMPLQGEWNVLCLLEYFQLFLKHSPA